MPSHGAALWAALAWKGHSVGLGRGNWDPQLSFPCDKAGVKAACWGRVKLAGQAGVHLGSMCHCQSQGSHPFCPTRKPPPREAREGSAGVCSGRNWASIDLLLLKPELLSGTLQPGCPHTCFLERAVLRALTGEGQSPHSTWPCHWPNTDLSGIQGKGDLHSNGSWGANSSLGTCISTTKQRPGHHQPCPSLACPAPLPLPMGLRAVPALHSGC